MKKKVLHIISDFNFGGVEVAVKQSISFLNKNYSYTVVVFGSINETFISNLDQVDRMKIIQLNYKSIFFFRDFINFIRYLKSNEVSIIITSLWKSVFLYRFSRFFLNKHVHLHFIHNTATFHFLDKFFTSLGVSSSDIVLCDSYSSKIFIKNTYQRDSQVVSFITKRMIGTPRNFKSISKYKFLFLGRISNQKRLDRAIDFVAYLKCCGLNVTFDIYGIGGYEEKNFLINHIKSKNIDDDVISFYPPVPHENLSSILLNYDFYLQTSQFEGMAMSVTEALQSGLVCLVTPVGEIKYYGIDQNNLLLFNGFNERSFLRLHEALKEPEKLDTISRNAITTFCDESTYNESLVEILNTI